MIKARQCDHKNKRRTEADPFEVRSKKGENAYISTPAGLLYPSSVIVDSHI